MGHYRPRIHCEAVTALTLQFYFPKQAVLRMQNIHLCICFSSRSGYRVLLGHVPIQKTMLRLRALAFCFAAITQCTNPIETVVRKSVEEPLSVVRDVFAESGGGKFDLH